jgi:hypothetical protein
MNVLANLAVGAVRGRLLNSKDDEKRRNSYTAKRRRSLVQRIYEKERKLQVISIFYIPSYYRL